MVCVCRGFSKNRIVVVVVYIVYVNAIKIKIFMTFFLFKSFEVPTKLQWSKTTIAKALCKNCIRAKKYFLD